MNASCNNELVLFFEKLTYFPLICVQKHLNFSSSLLYALLSEKWEAVIRERGERGGTKMASVWDIKMTKEEVLIQLEFENKTKENFGICFKRDPESAMTKDVMVHQERNLVTFSHKAYQHLKDTCFKALQLIEFLFPPISYNRISLSLGSRSPGFPFRFLAQLPRGTVKHISLHADKRVDGADLVKFLEKVSMKNEMYDFKMQYTLVIGVSIKNLVKCDEFVLKGNFARITDARFLTGSFLNPYNFVTSEIGRNNFTSKDFNSFLRAWMEDKNGYCLTEATFDIHEDQDINIVDLMQGLNPHFGFLRIRDRWRFEFPVAGDHHYLYPTAIDLADGWDIKSNQGALGTVLLDSNRLTFVTSYNQLFSWKSYIEYTERSIRSHTREIERLNRNRDIIHKKVDAGKMELFPAQVTFLKEYQKRMKFEQELLPLACEVKKKLLTVWNDGNIYTPPVRDDARPTAMRTLLLLGSSSVALDDILLALQFSKVTRRGFTGYTKVHEGVRIQIFPITSATSITEQHLDHISSVIYAYSDSDSFDCLTVLFMSLRKKFRATFDDSVRKIPSMLLQLPGSADKNQPDQFDVESFQRNTWSDLYEFDPNSNSDSSMDSDMEYFIHIGIV